MKIPGGVWTLGFVSLLMDTSSELIHALLPLYMVGALGASVLVVGLIEGFAEALALIIKVFSGYWSDVTRHRKRFVVLGYGLAAVSKLAFPLAPTLGWIVAGRFADRVGKGIRGAPRDALIADLTPASVRGAAFGLRQALDTVGAIAGPLLAVAAIGYFAGDFRAAFWVAIVPAALCVALLVFGVHESRPSADEPDTGATRVSWRDARRLDRRFHIVTAIAFVLTLARFSEAFLVLRAQDVGMGTTGAPWVMVAMSIVYAAIAFPAGPRGRPGTRHDAAVRGTRRAGRQRHRSRARRQRRRRAGGCGIVGIAHGADARAARGADRRDGARRPPRNGIRRLQPGERDRAARWRAALPGTSGNRSGRPPRSSPALRSPRLHGWRSCFRGRESRGSTTIVEGRRAWPASIGWHAGDPARAEEA